MPFKKITPTPPPKTHVLFDELDELIGQYLTTSDIANVSQVSKNFHLSCKDRLEDEKPSFLRNKIDRLDLKRARLQQENMACLLFITLLICNPVKCSIVAELSYTIVGARFMLNTYYAFKAIIDKQNTQYELQKIEPSTHSCTP